MTPLRIVIPAIDEAAVLPGLFADLAAQRGVVFETIVADGGSADATAEICAAHSVRRIETAPGRARQMNAGAAGFRGDWLFFLHADCRLPAPDQLAGALRQLAPVRGDAVGHFALSFMIDDKPATGFLYRFMAQKTASGRRYTINGDQGLLIRRETFQALGGFDTRLGFLEDQRMMTALHRRSVPIIGLRPALQTSARRFVAEGAARRYALMGLIMAMHIGGFETFFADARGVYARQDQTRPLRLRPFVRLAWAQFADRGFLHSAPSLWQLSGVAIGEAWQLALAVDVISGRAVEGSGPATRFHDAVVAGLLALPPCRMLLFCLLAIAIFGPAWCLRLFSPAGVLPRMT